MTKKKILLIMTSSAICLMFIYLIMATAQSKDDASPLENPKQLERAVKAIERNYVDPERISPSKMLEGALDRLELSIPEILVKDVSPGQIIVTVGLAQKQFNTSSLGTLSDLNSVLADILRFIGANYHGETKPEDIEYGAIDGMLEVLDPHSNFMSPKLYKEFQVGTRGKFGGLGIVISIKDGQLAVIAPIEGTPAARAGIRAGDKILQIDEESTINMSLTDAVNKLRGDVGSKVSIVIEHTGRPPKKLTLTRAIINIDSVQHVLISEGTKRIGYIKVKNFQANTNEDVEAALKEFHANNEKIDGLILDLRNNPGGLLNICVELADLFLKEGTIVSTVGPRDQVLEKEVARTAGTEPNYPLIVLINEGSASASEIVAGALQTHNRALVMGRRSFGKGSVQTVFDLGDDAALKLTIAQYKPAGTQSIQLEGVVPDVDMMPVTVDAKFMNLFEDIFPSEGDLESHLDGGAAKVDYTQKSLIGIRYLKPKEDEKELESKSAKEYTEKPDIEKDFTIKLASKMLATTSSADRKQMYEQVLPEIKKAQQEQDNFIDLALKELGINWSIARETKGKPKLKLAYHLFSDKSEVLKANAGKKVQLELSATNIGDAPYSRLIAVGQSDMPFLMNLEFVFGLVEPGATRKWAIPIELPEGLTRQDIPMDLTFETEGTIPPEPLNVIIPVEEISKPLFAFKYTLPNEVKGKNIGLGQSIPLNIDITNIGTGASSPETTVTLSNECGEKFFIEKGRMKVGTISPKTSKKVMFKFHTGSGIDDKNCSVKLAASDTKKYIYLSEAIDLLINGGNTKPAQNKTYQAPVIEVEKTPTSTIDSSIKISGIIKDPEKVRDYYVFVNDKKITYVPNPNETNEMNFSVQAPLDPGPNQITIGARNAFDLMGRKIVIINRTTGEKKDKKFRARKMSMGNE